MRTTRILYSALIAAVALTACGVSTSTASLSHPTNGTSTSTATASSSTTGLRATALAWAHAFLTGTVIDIYNLQGPDCLTDKKPTPSNIAAATRLFQQERARIAQRAGMSTATIQSKIVGVSIRNMSDRTGEAEVRYDLPVRVTGNYNWVTYGLIGGKWKVQDCHTPFGGSGSESSSVATTTP